MPKMIHTEKLFYEMVCSFVDSHNIYKNLSLKSIKKMH